MCCLVGFPWWGLAGGAEGYPFFVDGALYVRRQQVALYAIRINSYHGSWAIVSPIKLYAYFMPRGDECTTGELSFDRHW